MSKFKAFLTEDKNIIKKVYELRYHDMIKEYKPSAKKDNEIDQNVYDKYAEHLVVIDEDNDEVIGYYRLINGDKLKCDQKFSSEMEFNIDDIKKRQGVIELSRAVIKKEYRNAIVLKLLWKEILKYMDKNNAKYFIGTVSFKGIDYMDHIVSLSYLHNNYLNKEFDIKSHQNHDVKYIEDSEDSQESLPPLVKAYIRFGCSVSRDIFIDYDFGSVDVFVIGSMENANQAFIRRLLR